MVEKVSKSPMVSEEKVKDGTITFGFLFKGITGSHLVGTITSKLESKILYILEKSNAIKNTKERVFPIPENAGKNAEWIFSAELNITTRVPVKATRVLGTTRHFSAQIGFSLTDRATKSPINVDVSAYRTKFTRRAYDALFTSNSLEQGMNGDLLEMNPISIDGKNVSQFLRETAGLAFAEDDNDGGSNVGEVAMVISLIVGMVLVAAVVFTSYRYKRTRNDYPRVEPVDAIDISHD